MPAQRRDALRSKEAVKRAYTALAINRRTDKITVRSVLEAAGISRGTFYAHFRDIYDVREQVENDLLQSCLSALSERDATQVASDPYPEVLVVARFFADHAEQIARLSDTPDRAFLSKFKDILLEGLRRSDHTVMDPENNAVADACAVSACVDGCFEMVRRGYAGDPEKTARTVSAFISAGLSAVR